MLNYLIIWRSLCLRCAVPETPGSRNDAPAIKKSGGYRRILKAISQAGMTGRKAETRRPC